MNPKTEEIVKSLRGCSADEMDCKNCVAEWGRKYGYCFNMLRLYAADRLEKLETELSKLKAQQRWTPVAERLPENNDDVLIVPRNANCVNVGCFNVNSKAWYDYAGMVPADITHWMPLPEPPKEEHHESERA